MMRLLLPRIRRTLLFMFAGAMWCGGAFADDAAPGAARSPRASSAVRGAAPPVIVAPPGLSLDADRALGDRNASLFIVEFGDYQCPYCRRYHLDTFPELKRRYIDTGAARYFFKDFPLDSHRQAIPAAIVARCAGEQGKYWQMQQRLYDEQPQLGAALYQALATELKLDSAAFAACRQKAQTRLAVMRDRAEGGGSGIKATPSFILGRIVDGRIVIERVAEGAPGLEVFAKELDALREKK